MLEELFERTHTFPQMNVEEAMASQFRLCDVIQRHFGSDDFYMAGDFGQDRSLAVLQFGGGGRPSYTVRVEQTLADYFGAEDAVLVHGAGTGAIRAMLNAGVNPGDRILLNQAHVYKTTLPTMRHMGLQLRYADYSSTHAIVEALTGDPPAALYIQRVTQQLGEHYEASDVIRVARKHAPGVKVLVDENYAVFRAPHLSVRDGADASAFSLFKLLANSHTGIVIGKASLCADIRRDLSSAGCQVSGPDAMAALRALVYVPVALAIQHRVVEQVVERINEGIVCGEFPLVRRAYSIGGIRCAAIQFQDPVAEQFLRAAWRSGSPSRSVGEESRHEVTPLFTTFLSTFLKGTPGLERWVVRVNPFRSGPDTVMRVFKDALAAMEADERSDRK